MIPCPICKNSLNIDKLIPLYTSVSSHKERWVGWFNGFLGLINCLRGQDRKGASIRRGARMPEGIGRMRVQ